ncbi:hypothetical protein ABZ260_46905, partial [Streptosporangium sp. NPDC006013]|uniref:hypothetical protein n=1 Tax=Streptosporangium sp. NPDC006013 TaxID=3155596 RepID=UPI0033A7E5FA
LADDLHVVAGGQGDLVLLGVHEGCCLPDEWSEAAAAAGAEAAAGACPQHPASAAWLAAAGLPQQEVAAASAAVLVSGAAGPPQHPPAAGGVNASSRFPMNPPLMLLAIAGSLRRGARRDRPTLMN